MNKGLSINETTWKKKNNKQLDFKLNYLLYYYSTYAWQLKY